MSDRIVLASRNPKKATELRTLLEPMGVRVVPLDAIPGAPEVEETGATFEANARLKAEAARDAAGLPALADDSGLEVTALGGAPGVRSARFAGEEADDAANNAELLRRLADVAEADRGARFVSVLAFAAPGAETRLFRGETSGTILAAPRGAGGFGYDPLFLSDDLGITFGEAPPERKHAVSHRGRALEAFLAWFRAGRTA
jgi:XTP/dITP diphosphohydrolase